ncbi:nucleoside deaminase [Aeromicrobium sp. 179-A 4D2 NHS]|uniref:nucleoside deaminase n=1 Tax=Aeromicrobium sp. 179-A 4D2 NHS TaxID=3142375 RepID=UPI0039A13D0D
MTRPDDARWLSMAVDLAVENVSAGGGPFGALIVRGDEVVATGQNRVTRDLDPSAHAEVVAIRAACREVGDFSLAGLTLYTSCEPCPMCLATSLWARLGRVVYTADRDDAARGGFDDREFYELFARDRSTWQVLVEGMPTEAAARPFDTWLAHAAKVTY